MAYNFSKGSGKNKRFNYLKGASGDKLKPLSPFSPASHRSSIANYLSSTTVGSDSSTRLLDTLHSGTRRTGQQGQAVKGDGTDDEIIFGDIGTAIWFSGWVRLDSDNQCLFSLANTSATALSVAAGVLTAGATLTLSDIRIDDVSKTASEAGALLNDNAWHFLSCDIGDGLGGASTANDLRVFADGTAHGAVSGFDWRFWSTAPTAAELTEAYSGATASRNSAAVSKYALWAKLDEQDGVTAYDSSGNSNSGTLTNMTLANARITQDIYSFQNQVGYNEGSNLIKDSLTLVSGWSGSNITLMSGINDPDGGVNAIKVEATSTAATSLAQVIQPLAASSGYYVYSCYIKKGSSGTDFGYLNLRINSGPRIGNIAIGLINFDTGVLTVIGNANAAGSITDVGDGWYLVEIYDDTIVAGDQMRVYVASGGSNLSAGIFAYFYAPQLEAGTQRRATQLTGDYYLTEDTILPRDESDPTNDVLGNPLTYTGRRPNDAGLINSNCVTLNGTNQAVRVADNTALDITDNLTVSVWAKNDNALIGTTHTILGKYDVGVNKREFHLSIDPNEKILVAIGNATGVSATAEISDDVIDPSALRHYAATFESGTVKLYMDGVLMPSTTAGTHAATLNNDDADLIIGSLLNSDAILTPWDGQIFDARVYAGDSTVLTAEQIASIYADPTGNIEFTGQSLRAHYKLAEGAGIACLDASENANHGTIENAASNWGVKQDVYHSNLLEGCGKRMWFDGVNDYVEIQHNANLSLTNDIDIYVKFLTTDNTSQQTILSKGFATSTNYTIDILSGKLRFFGYTSGGPLGITVGSFSVSNNATYSVRCTFDGTTWRIYVNGSLEQTQVNAGTLDANALNLTVGKRSAVFLKGIIYDVVIGKSTGIISSYNGYGNTDADWIDQIGSNNGTVVGSPEAFYIPASTSALDAFGQPLTDPFIDGFRNRAETEFDYNPDSTPEMANIYSESVFDGSTSNGYVSNDSLMNFTDNLTVTCWAKSDLTGISSSADTLVSLYESTGNLRVWRMEVSTAEKLAFHIGNAGGTSTTIETADSAYPIDTWTHYAATFDGGVVKLYINGELQGSSANSAHAATLNGRSGPIVLGAFFWSGGGGSFQEWDGSLRNVRIYKGDSRPMDSAEINKDLYETDYQPRFEGQTVIASYDLVKDTLDRSGNGFHATNTAISFTKKTLPSAMGFGDDLGEDGIISKTVKFEDNEWGAVFDGSSYINLKRRKKLDITTETFEIEATIKFTGAGAYDIFSKYLTTGSQGSYRFYVSGGDLFFTSSSTGANTSTLIGSVAVNDGSWHRVKVIRETASSTSAKLYIDGVEDTGVAGSIHSSFFNSTAVSSIGGYNVTTTPAGLFSGNIRDLRVKVGGIEVAYWELAKDTRDSTPNEYHGTNTGVTFLAPQQESSITVLDRYPLGKTSQFLKQYNKSRLYENY